MPAVLIKRQKQHFHALPCGVEVILGNNGYVWLSPPGAKEGDAAAAPATAAPVDADVRERICRVRNAIAALGAAFLPVYAATIMDVYSHSVGLGLPAKALSEPAHLQLVTQTAARRVADMGGGGDRGAEPQ